MKIFICIDVGGTSIKHGVATENAELLTTSEIPTEASLKGGAGIVEKAKNIIKTYLNDYKIDGICMSTAGVVDTVQGKIIYAYEKFIPDYTGIELKKIMENEFNIRCEVENDVNCAGLCEATIGAGKGKNPVVCLTIGTGIGGCIIIDNKVISGFSNSAGEFGYSEVRGKGFQDLASTTSLVLNVATRKGIDISELNGKKIFELANSGDKDCIEAINDMAKHLGIGVSNICYLINPEIVILGGGIMAQQDTFKSKIEAEMKNQLLPTIFENSSIGFAQMKNTAGMLGALLNFLKKNPQ